MALTIIPTPEFRDFVCLPLPGILEFRNPYGRGNTSLKIDFANTDPRDLSFRLPRLGFVADVEFAKTRSLRFERVSKFAGTCLHQVTLV
jgi:hypothetical protein